MWCFRQGVLCAFMVAGWVMHSTQVQAALSFTKDFHAEFTFTVVPGSPLIGLGLPSGTVLDFDAFGPLTFTLDDSVPNASTMNFTNVTGSLLVAGPPAFAGSTMNPQVQFLGGQLTGISRDGGGAIVGGNVTNLSMRWEMLSGGNRLYTRDGLPFNGAVTGAPFGVGNVLSGPDPFNVYLDVGAGVLDPLAVIGSNRILTVTTVPEPSSLLLLSLASLGVVGFKRRKQHQVRSSSTKCL